MGYLGKIIRFKQGLTGILLLIFSAYYINSTMFYHQHIVDGNVIIHSHFHSDIHTDSSENGGHDLEIAKLIAVLGNIVALQQYFDIKVSAIERLLEGVIEVSNSYAATLHVDHLYLLRAPPAEVLA